MKTSETQTALIGALFAARQEFPVIAKTKSGQAGNRPFKYAPIEDILDAVNPVLAKHGLLLTQPPDGHSIVTRLEHVSGEWRESSMPVNAEHANNQSYGIELSYRRRYSLQMMLGIVTEEDTDGVGDKTKRKGIDNTRNANGTLPGPGVISAAAEIAASFAKHNPDRAAELDERALDIIEHYESGRQISAVNGYYSILDNEEKAYVWHQLKAVSKLRSFLKANSPQQQKAAA